jgi:hypothetical protein
LELPSAPQVYDLTAGDSCVTLTWSSPTIEGNSSVDYYLIYKDGVEIERVARTSSLIQNVTVTGLVNGQTYSFSIAAHSSLGTGSVASWSSVIPLKASTPPSDPNSSGLPLLIAAAALLAGIILVITPFVYKKIKKSSPPKIPPK